MEKEVRERIVGVVKDRLSDFGYEVSSQKDSKLIQYLVEKRAKEIKSFCNIYVISSKLEIIITENVTGEFLFAKKNTDNDIVEKIEKLPLRSMKIGDTNTTFADSSKSYESRFDEAVNYLQSYGKDILAECRRIKW